MPRPKAEFDQLYPCDFYTPSELLDPDSMYSVYEIARLLQELDPDAELDVETEEILLDWAIPWVMRNADELVVAEPPSEEEPGYYGLRTDGDLGGIESGTAPAETGADGESDGAAGTDAGPATGESNGRPGSGDSNPGSGSDPAS